MIQTTKSHPIPKLLAVLGLVAVLALPMAGCSNDSRADESPAEASQKDGKATPRSEEAVPVQVAALDRGEIEAILRFSTNLEAENAVAVYSQASRQVRELRVEEGKRVRRGEVLVRLQDDEQRNALAKVQSQLDKARREYERQQRLFAQELISEQAMNDSTYEREQLELALEEAARQLTYTEVRAPISGTITQRMVNRGDTVVVNQHLFDIVDFDSIVARVYVPEKELPRLTEGQQARISSPALGAETYTGRVDRLAPTVDPKSGTVKVTVAIPSSKGLRPGMFVDVTLVTDTKTDALLVPKRALVYDNDQIFIYRLAAGGADADSRVERLLVRPRLEDKDNIEPAVVEGAQALREGDRIVVAGQAGLKDGAKVRLLDAAPLAGGEAEATPAREMSDEPAL